MGFLSDLKTAAKNTSDRADQEYETQKYKSEINSKKNDIEKGYREIGELYYQNVKDPDADFAGKSKEIVDRIDADLARIDELGLNKEDYDFYLDLRKYGTARHAGFGLGFERAVQYVTGMQNIRDVIPYPRASKQADF